MSFSTSVLLASLFASSATPTSDSAVVQPSPRSAATASLDLGDLTVAGPESQHSVTWTLSGCTEQHRDKVDAAVQAIQARLPSPQKLRVNISIVAHEPGSSRWTVVWTLADNSHNFDFEGEDCDSLADATVEMLHSAFPEPMWSDTAEQNGQSQFDTGPIDVDALSDSGQEEPEDHDSDDLVVAAPDTVPLDARAKRKQERRIRFRTPQSPKIVEPRWGTLSVRGGLMFDFWKPWSQFSAGIDIHFPRNFAIEVLGQLNHTRHDLSSDPAQDLRVGGTVRACNLRKAGRSLEIAFCIGVDVLSRQTSRFLAQTDTRIDHDSALELAFSTRTALVWWVHRKIGLSANLELAGRFAEWRIVTGARLRTPRPFRAVVGLGIEFGLPRSGA